MTDSHNRFLGNRALSPETRGTSPSAVMLPVRLGFEVGPEHRSRVTRIGTQRLRRAVSATAIARAKDRSAFSRVQGSLPLQVWINAYRSLSATAAELL